MQHHFKILILLLSCAIGTNPAYGQSPILDSLKTELNKARADTTRVKLLNDIGWEYSQRSEYDSATIYTGRGLTLANKINYGKGISLCYSGFGRIYKDKGEVVKAIDYYQKALQIDQKWKDTLRQGINKYNLGILLSEIAQPADALKNLQDALKIFEKYNNVKNIGMCYNGIGTIYSALHDFDRALPYHQRSLAINEKNGFKSNMIHDYNNIASVLHEYKKDSEAKAYLLKALSIAIEIDDKVSQARIYNNIGTYYDTNNDHDKALINYHKALKIAEEIKSDGMMYLSYLEIGQAYYYKNQAPVAKKWLKKALVAAQKTQSLQNLRDVYGAMSAVDSLAGDFKSAFNNSTQFYNYTSDIFGEDKVGKTAKLELTYAFEKKRDSTRLVNEKEIALRDANIKSRQQMQKMYFAGLVGLGLIGAILFYQSRQRKKQNTRLQQLNTELDEANRIKARFFGILNHDLRSPVSNIIKFIRLQQSKNGTLEHATKQRLESETVTAAENLLASMEDLLLWSKGQMEQFKPVYRDVPVATIFEDTARYFSNTETVRFHFEDAQNTQLHSDINYLKTIVRNLSSNAVKALAGRTDGFIQWKAWSVGKTAFLSITDNGPGAGMEQFKALYDDSTTVGIKTGLGLHLIRDLAKAINCKVQVDVTSQQGTTILLSLQHSIE